MNPEEGRLRPQILDRFGLRVIVRGLTDAAERLEAYRRVQTFFANPRGMTENFAGETIAAAAEIRASRELLPRVALPDAAAGPAIGLIQQLGVDSLRAEITWFEAARAHAAADARDEVSTADLRAVAPMSLRLRRSQFMADYFGAQTEEETQMTSLLDRLDTQPQNSRHRRSGR
jgi:magnesium chelatase subunit I